MGDLSQETLGGIIRNLYLNCKSGILHLSREEVRKRIYFRNGSIIFASSDAPEDRLGEFLIRAGKVDRTAVDLASRAAEDGGKRIGRTLVELGHMTEEEMLAMVVRQIEGIIYSLFEWDSGEYRFEPHESPVAEDIVLSLPTANIILEGTRRVKDSAAIRRALGDPEQVLRHSHHPLLLYQEMNLTPSEGFVLSRVDSTTSVAEIASMSPLGEEQTLHCIYSLVSAGVLELQGTARPSREEPVVDIPGPEPVSLEAEAPAKPPPPSPEELAVYDDIASKHASLQTATHYEVLGISTTATDAEIKKAYYAMAKKYHPDRHRSPRLKEMRSLLEELLVRITAAYEVLSNPLERRRYDASLPAETLGGEVSAPTAEARPTPVDSSTPGPDERTAEIRYREGRRHFEEMRFFDAIQSLSEAVRVDPGKVSYRKLLARALAKNPNWLKKAEEHLQKAIEIDAYDPEIYVVLGQIYEASGMKTRAQKMYQKALNLDPGNELAREGLHGRKRPGLMDILRGKKQ